MTDYTIETREYKGFTIEIWRDDYAESPREWDNVATFVCEHRNYNFGDEQLDKMMLLDGITLTLPLTSCLTSTPPQRRQSTTS